MGKHWMGHVIHMPVNEIHTQAREIHVPARGGWIGPKKAALGS